ncbi:hypothetical protein CcaCcLH18_10750 [Colletotrichum camelliae]|nr:hypothetical protein CcaCcLH18_10750 [Colletotrichum camelliae]
MDGLPLHRDSHWIRTKANSRDLPVTLIQIPTRHPHSKTGHLTRTLSQLRISQVHNRKSRANMERTAHDLCTVCSRFAERLQLEAADSAAIKPGHSMPFAADLHELRQRALDGCTLCQIFFQAILYYGEPGDGSTFMSYFHGEPVKLEFVELSDYLSEPEDEEDGFGICAWFLLRYPHFELQPYYLLYNV